MLILVVRRVYTGTTPLVGSENHRSDCAGDPTGPSPGAMSQARAPQLSGHFLLRTGIEGLSARHSACTTK